MTISFTVPGAPHGKGRPRFANRGKFVQTYTDDKTASYENLVKLAASRSMAGIELLTCPVAVELYLFVTPPASWSKKKTEAALAGEVFPTTKPDVDNVLKSIADAINGIVWGDDKQMVDVLIRKRYAVKPCAHVVVRGMSNAGS